MLVDHDEEEVKVSIEQNLKDILQRHFNWTGALIKLTNYLALSQVEVNRPHLSIIGNQANQAISLAENISLYCQQIN